MKQAAERCCNCRRRRDRLVRAGVLQLYSAQGFFCTCIIDIYDSYSPQESG